MLTKYLPWPSLLCEPTQGTVGGWLGCETQFQVYWRLRMTDIQQQEVPENTTMSKYCQMLSKSIGVVWRVLGISAVEGIMAEREGELAAAFGSVVA
ncbi:hypothetical protein BC936DRAFT_138813 [Jimgerdemannia flammicorona]|uniref:Uncharacterized protein n=1 Tax=Jimgerdemannia flammicorona TaxID=994334 RepID=A0A433BHR3_9FUNG|nr:hypothetical protein BC936DRAFT_138813 [Jimgerdemannia flammicorona]